MIVLYQFPTSPFGEKVRRMLNYKGLAFEIRNVPRAEVPAYAHVSPTGKFPAIQDGDTAVWDSTDIAYYLEAKAPQPPLIPADPAQAGLVHVFEDWADESLYFYEVTMRIAWAHNAEGRTAQEFAATMPGMTPEQVVPLISAGADAMTRGQGIGRKPRERIALDAERHIRALAALVEGRDWLVGEALSLADIAVASQVRVLRYAREVEAVWIQLPALQRWFDRVDQAAPATNP